MKNAPGYPLPSGELGDDDIVCQLVYLPDRPEYWQAFLAALHYMTTWLAWERDDDKRGKDAAANWREAFELTIGCWRMTCLEQLQDDVAAILAIMEQGQLCCDETDVTDGDQYTDRVEDGVGNVPQNIIDAGYASGTSDWTGFDDYKCMIAHVTVDQLYARLVELAPHVTSASMVIGGMATIAAIITTLFTGGLTAIAFGLVASTGAVALLYQGVLSGDLLEILAAKVTTNHDDLACAIYNSDGDDESLSNLNDEIDSLFTVVEAVILKSMNLGPTLKALYAGRYDQQDIAEILDDAGYELGDFECVCDDRIGEYLIQYTWPVVSDWDNWTHGPSDSIVADGIAIYCTQNHYGTGFTRLSTNQLGNDLGLSDLPNRQYYIRKITFNTKATAANAGIAKIGMSYQGGSQVLFSFSNELTWTEFDTLEIEDFDDPGYRLIAGGWIQLFPDGGSGNYIRFDSVTIDFDSSII